MSLLLLDVGNSRLKWALLREPYRRAAPFAACGALTLQQLRGERSQLVRLFEALTRSGLLPRVHVCNVAGTQIERELRSAARRTKLGPLHFARSSAVAGGVRNGYREVWRLGADRWLGMIGARHQHPEMDLCIVSVGTAMTIDLLDADGRHVGGSIIPGPQLMIDSLLIGTAGIARRAGGRGAVRDVDRARGSDGTTSSRLFAHDTRGALLAGARHACAAAIEHARREAGRQLGRRPRLLLGGGAMEAIAPLLHSPYRRENDLILRGLAVIAGTPASGIA